MKSRASVLRHSRINNNLLSAANNDLVSWVVESLITFKAGLPESKGVENQLIHRMFFKDSQEVRGIACRDVQERNELQQKFNKK